MIIDIFIGNFKFIIFGVRWDGKKNENDGIRIMFLVVSTPLNHQKSPVVGEQFDKLTVSLVEPSRSQRGAGRQKEYFLTDIANIR